MGTRGDIEALKEVIAELQKCDHLTEEQVEKLNKNILSIKAHKAKKAKKADQEFKQELKDMGSNIKRQIDTAMRDGVPEEGNFEKPKQESGQRKQSNKPSHLKLVKALANAGHRESALLLKNWGEMDNIAKAMSDEIEKGALGDSITAAIKGSGSTPQGGVNAAIGNMFGKEEDDKKKKEEEEEEKDEEE